MLPDDVLERLSRLNRRSGRSAEHRSTPRQQIPIVRSADSHAAAARTPEPSGTDPRGGDRCPSSLPDGREFETPWGTHWLIENPLATLWPAGPGWIERVLSGRSASTGAEREELARLRQAFPRDVVYLDLETCGFAGSMIFLIGLLHQGPDDRPILSQLFARDYSEEKAVLQSMWRLVGGRSVLVTYNGKCFDWPMVQDRSTLHHLGRDNTGGNPPRKDDLVETLGCLRREDQRPSPLHCDLLFHVRRRWKGRLPNCRLQTLEQYVCGRRRTGDIPGREIPQAYHDFVRDGDAWRMRSVLRHNALDLITLLQLSLLTSLGERISTRSA